MTVSVYMPINGTYTDKYTGNRNADRYNAGIVSVCIVHNYSRMFLYTFSSLDPAT